MEGGGVKPDKKRELFMTDEDTTTIKSGRLPSRARFKQFNPEGTEDLDEWRSTFVETEDPTEYKAAIELCGSWEEWTQLKANWPHFRKKILPQWHLELEMKIRSAAMANLVSQASFATGTAAAKFIVEGKHNLRKYVIDPEAEVKGERVNEHLARDFDADIARIRRVERNND